MPKRKGKKSSAMNDIHLGMPEEPEMDDWDRDSDDGANGAPPEQSRTESAPARIDDDVEPPEQPRRKRDQSATTPNERDYREEIETVPKKKKKKKKKKRKGNTQAEEDAIPPVEPPIEPPIESATVSEDISVNSPEQGGKRKKKKKKKKGGAAAAPPPQEESEPNENQNRKKKRKNKKKKSLAQRVEERQESLLRFAKELEGDLASDLDEIFDDEQSAMFQDVVTDVVLMYQDDNSLADDEEFFEVQKADIQSFWDTLVDQLKELRDIGQEIADEETAMIEREERLAALKRQGLSVGPSGRSRTRVDHKAQQKRLERERLRKARELLAQQEAAEADSPQPEDVEEQKEEVPPPPPESDSDDNWDSNSDDEMPKTTLPTEQLSEREAPRRVPRGQRRDESESEEDEPKSQKKRQNRRRKRGKKTTNPVAEPEQSDQRQRRKKSSPTPEDQPPTPPPEEVRESSEAKPPSPPPEAKEEKEPPRTKGKKVKKALRSPICVVMGHVDAGKTKILDKIRRTNVQGGEAGGITQQIGATYLSIEHIKGRTELLREHVTKLKYKVPGLLFIDTPGHESFSNLRTRGSAMCDVAVLVVNIMEGIQPQTIESLNLLRNRGAQFVVAVNQIDRLNQWEPVPDAPFKTTFAQQNKPARNHFERLMEALKVQFAENGWNTALYYENRRIEEDMSLVPVSAHTGEGLPDLLMVVVTLTQKFMTHQLELSLAEEDFSCTILEVKNTVGHGATLDVILSNGVLRSSDSIAVCGMRGPIITPIRALLLPHEAQEMRVRGEFRVESEVLASAGVRISAHDLGTAVAGSSMLLVPRNLPKRGPRRGQILEALKDEVQSEFAEIMQNVSSTNHGVYVQASTLGALEALVKYLNDQNVPIHGINIGDVHKGDVMKAGTMLESRPEFALILAFNIRVAHDAQIVATDMGVQIFSEEIIYHLFDRFSAYIEGVREAAKRSVRGVAVFPCQLEVLPEHVINNRRPIILGCLVRRGTLRMGTPLVAKKPAARGEEALRGDYVFLGRVESIQSEGKDQEIANVGDKVAVKIVDATAAVTIQYGRQFDHNYPLVSLITRESLDALKENFRDELLKNSDDMLHLRELKRYFGVLG